MLLPLDIDHPVFKDFKYFEVKTHSSLIYPSGASGNFLGGLMQGKWWYQDAATNDWGATMNYLELDDCSVRWQDSQMTCAVNLDSLYSRAKDFVRNPQIRDTTKIATAHESPYLTSNIVNFHTNELIAITMREEHAWIAELLRVLKNKFTTVFTYKPWSLIEILNDILTKDGFHGTIDYLEYFNATEKLRDRVNGFRLLGSQFSILYFCDCKALGRDPADSDNFDAYIRENIYYSTAYQRFECDYYQQTRLWCAKSSDIYTPVDYCDLFFDLKLPERGKLSRIDTAQIKAYSFKNLDLLDEFVYVIPDPERALMQQTLVKLRQQLAEAVVCRDL